MAGDPTQNGRTEARAERVVFVCASDQATRRSFERQHGVQPVFVTAREAVAANAADEHWATPRCMTEREHRRFVALTGSIASR